MQNRIRILRNELNLTLPQMSKKLKEESGFKLTPDAISKYEREDREPKLETWQKLADFFEVPVGYLQGLTDDKVDWKMWEEMVGYSRQALKAQIARLIKAKQLSDDDTLARKIALAAATLEFINNSDEGAIKATQNGLYNLNTDILDRFYLDPQKIDPEKEEKNGYEIDFDESLYRDDMDKEVGKKISEVIQNAIDKLQDYYDEYLKRDDGTDTTKKHPEN